MFPLRPSQVHCLVPTLARIYSDINYNEPRAELSSWTRAQVAVNQFAPLPSFAVICSSPL